MNKKKKILFSNVVFFSVILIIVFSIVFFIKPICFYGFSSFLNHLVKKNTGSTIKFDSVRFKNKKVILKNVIISSPNNFKINADKIDIALVFKLLKATINTEIYCDSPHVVLYRNMKIPQKLKSKKNIFFSCFLKINQGLADLAENDRIIKQLGFNYNNFSDSVSKFEFFFKESADNKISVDISRVKETLTFSGYLKDAQTVHINDVFQFFNLNIFQDVKGTAGGSFLINVKDNKINRFFTNLDFSAFTFFNPSSSLRFDFQHLRIEGDYPNVNESDSLILKKIKSNFLKETKFKINFENLSIFTNRKSLFADLNGSFAYNPNLGCKLNVNGSIKNDKAFGFCLDSKAYLTSSYSNWLDINLSFDDKQACILFNAKEIDDCCNLHVSFNNIQPHIFEAFQDLFYNIFDQIDDFKFKAGSVNFCVDGRFNQKGFDKIFITDTQLKNFEFEKDKIKGFISKLEGRGSFDLSRDKFWSRFFSDVKINEAFFEVNNQKIQDLNAKIFTLDGIFQSSSVSCLVNKNQTNAEIKGKVEEFNVFLQSKGKLSKFDDNFSTILSCKRKNNNYIFSGRLKISDGQEAVFGFDLNNLFIFNFNDFKNHLLKGWIRAEKIAVQKWREILNIDTNVNGKTNIAAFYAKNKLHLQVKGEDLSYKNDYVDIKIAKIGNLNNYVFEGDNYINAYLDNGVLSCEFPSFEGSCYLPRFDILFDCKKGKIVIDNNVLKATLDAVSENVSLNGNVYLDFFKKHHVLTIDAKEYFCDIASLQKFLKHFGLNKEIDVAGKVKGDSKVIVSFEEKANSSYYINFDFAQADYKINKKAALENIFAHAQYLSDGTFTFSNLTGNLKLENNKHLVSCPVFNITKDGLDIDLRLENEIYDLLRIKGLFVQKDNKYVFDLDNEKTHLFGEKITSLELVFGLNYKIDNFKMSCRTNSFGFISQIQLLLDLGFLPIDNINLLSVLKNKHDGILDCDWSMNEAKNLVFEICSKNLKVFDKKPTDFLIKGTKSEKQLVIDKMLFDDFAVSLLMDIEPDALKIKDCLVKKKDILVLNIEGFYSQSSSTLNANISDIKIDLKKIAPFLSEYIKLPGKTMEGHLKGSGSCSFNFPAKGEKLKFAFDLDVEPSNLTIEKLRLYNSGLININLSSGKGFLMRGLDLNFYSKDVDLSYLTCKIGGILYDFEKRKWVLKDTNLFIPSSLKDAFQKADFLKPAFQYITVDNDIDLTCDIQFFSDLSNIAVSSKEADFYLNSKKLALKDIYFKINEKVCVLKFDYLHNGNYYTLQNDIELDKIIKGKTFFLEKGDNPSYEPLCVKWIVDEDNKTQVKEIEGYFCGADFLLQEDINNVNSNKLFGCVKINGSKLKEILPKSIAETINRLLIGKGYEFSGGLDLNFSKEGSVIFEGLFFGKDFEMLGYQFKTLLSKINIQKDKISLNDLKISDQSGILMLREFVFEKNENSWFLSIPLLKIKDLRPSLMQKINTSLPEITPFLIRELFLYDFRGKIGDRKSFSGHGYLHFINSFKRGHSVFDFPADVLSRIVGIDQALLTPVKGKIDLKVQEGKFYLASLKDSYSESERSKFFLVDKGTKPYIDFDGKIYINMAMKQYVLFKFTESFVISIRGNLGNPQCNLKKKRGFLK